MQHSLRGMIFLGTLGLAALNASATGPDDVHYRSRQILIGYPDPIPSIPAGTLDATADLRQVWRIAAIRHPNITKSEAETAARTFKTEGFNLIISEGSRYLFRDSEDPLKSSAVLRKSSTFEKVIQETRTMAEACQRQGLKFALHLTCTMVDATIIEAHPEWAEIDLKTGKTFTNNWGTANACINNDEFMNEFFRRLTRLIREAKPDGIMQDEIQFFGSSNCGCQSCRTKFKAATGYDLPAPEDFRTWAQTPALPAWREWRRECVVNGLQKMRDVMKKNNPDGLVLHYLCNLGSGHGYAMAGLVINDFPRFADSIGYECSPQNKLYLYQWPLVAQEIKYERAVAEQLNCPPWTLFYNRRNGDYLLNWFLAMTQGSRSWWLVDDPVMTPSRQFPVAWEARHEAIFPNLTAAANIGVLYSLDSRDRGPVAKKHRDHRWIHGFAGTCQALTFNHVPYRVVVDADLTAETLSRKLKTLVLFNTTCLSDKACAAIRQFVQEGGVLIASGEASLYDQTGALRPDFALADLFGASYAGDYTGEAQFVVSRPNPVTGQFTGSFKHPNRVARLKNLSSDIQVLGMIKSPKEEFPGLLVRKVGKGKVVYFPGHPELRYMYHFYNVNNFDLGKPWIDDRDEQWGRLIAATAQAFNDELPLVVENLPREVVAEVHRQDSKSLRGVQVHLANFLGSRIESGVISRIYEPSFPEVKPLLPNPDRPIGITVQVKDVKKVYLISPDYDALIELPFERQGPQVHVNLPRLDRYALLYFVQVGDEELLRLYGGKSVRTIPPARKLVIETRVPLVGSYDSTAAVAFADTPAMAGGVTMYDGIYKDEVVRFLYGTADENSTVQTTLTIKNPPVRPVLEIGGMDGGDKEKTSMTIRLNGRTIYQGDSPFPNNLWAVHSFPIEPSDLRPDMNMVEIVNTGKGFIRKYPWLGISFVRIKPQPSR